LSHIPGLVWYDLESDSAFGADPLGAAVVPRRSFLKRLSLAAYNFAVGAKIGDFFGFLSDWSTAKSKNPSSGPLAYFTKFVVFICKWLHDFYWSLVFKLRDPGLNFRKEFVCVRKFRAERPWLSDFLIALNARQPEVFEDFPEHLAPNDAGN